MENTDEQGPKSRTGAICNSICNILTKISTDPIQLDSWCLDVLTWTTVLLDAMCLVITLTHVNYKLLVLYRICYRVYTRSQIINYK